MVDAKDPERLAESKAELDARRYLRSLEYMGNHFFFLTKLVCSSFYGRPVENALPHLGQ